MQYASHRLSNSLCIGASIETCWVIGLGTDHAGGGILYLETLNVHLRQETCQEMR